MSGNRENSENRYFEVGGEKLSGAENELRPMAASEGDTRQIWQVALRDLHSILGRSEYDAWIKNLALVELNNEAAMITAPSSYARQRVESDYAEVVNQALSGVVGHPLTVHFLVESPVQGQLFDSASSPAIPQAAQPQTSYRMSANHNHLSRPAAHGIKSKGPYLDLEDGGGRGSQNRRSNSYYSGNNGSRNGYNASRNVANNTYYEDNRQGYTAYQEEAPELDDPITPPPYRNNDAQNAYEAQALRSGLNPRYTFDKYIVGSSNRMAEAAGKRVAETPGSSYNPLFVYGGVGLGKTHLLHAIGHEALRLRPYLKVLYVSSEKFTNDLINGIREQRMEDFRNRYRSIDILMIDDIQFIAGKDQTQEEFFHTFNTLVESGKQVVISSDRPPKSMLTLEDRLRSRFEGGLITDVSLPDYEMRLLILRAKAEYQPQPNNQPIPTEVLEFLAHKLPTNIRELEGALIRVVAFGLLNKMPISVDLAAQALNDSVLNSRKKLVTKERIVEAVANFYNLEVKDLQGKSRSADIVLPRQIAMFIIREQTDHSLVEIGQALGNRDHTTVMHGLAKIEQAIETNTQLRQQINTITQIIYNGEGLK